jgi:geranylgeranyl pyrophosphate synthase
MIELTRERTPEGALYFQEAFSAVKASLPKLLREAPPIIRPLTAHLAKAAGKMIRAEALLVCAEDKRGLINPDAVKAAAAVELLHLATLVHDDIIDKAEKRRGLEALYLKFGEKNALLCGDYLFCRALDLAAEIKLLEHRKDSADRTLPHYLTEICLGELRQNQNAYNYELTEKEYFKIINGKTAAMFEASSLSALCFPMNRRSLRKSIKSLGIV